MLFFTERGSYMFEPKIDVQQAVAGLRKREKGLITYEKIMTSYKNTNLSNDMTFQRTFNGFYRIRRNEDWRKFYYESFEKWWQLCVPIFLSWTALFWIACNCVCVVQTAKQNSKTLFLYTKIFSNGIRNFCLPEQQNHT